MLPETTIAPSTTMPTANARPASEMTLMLRPARSSAQNVASRQIGIVLAISDGRTRIAHEPPHAREREQGADHEILDQQVDGALDEQRRIERLLDAQAPLLERSVAQLRDDFLHFLERAEHVGARRAHDAQTDRRIAVLIGEEAAIGRPHLDRREIREAHRLAVAPREHELPEVLGIVASRVAQRILPAPDVELAGGDVGRTRGLARDVRDADAERGRARQIER